MGLFVSPEDDENENKVDTSSFRRQIIAHRAKIFFAIFVVVAVVVIAVVIGYISKNNAVYTEYQVLNSVECKMAEGSHVLSFQNMFITYSLDGIHCTDAKGKDIWSTPYQMQSPIIDICEGYVAVADYNGRNIYVFNTSGELGNIQTNAPIKNINVSASGTVAVLIDDDKATPINLYYYDGTMIATFRTTMSKSGYPVALGLSSDSKLLAVSYLYLDNGALTSKVAFYNFGEVGQNESDNLVSGYDYQGELIPVVGFLNSSTSFAVANDKLVFYSGKERPTNSANIMIQDEIQAVFHGDDCVGLLFYDNTGTTRYRLDVYEHEKLKSQIFFDEEYSDIFFANDMVVIYNAVEASIYTQTGNLKYNGIFTDGVRLMIPTNSYTKYTLVHDESIETVVLK